MKSNASVIRQPLYKQGVERYPYNFKHIDNDNIDYLNFLGSKYSKSQDSQYFNNQIDEDYFFNMIKTILMDRRYTDSHYEFEIFCYRYGIDGRPELLPK